MNLEYWKCGYCSFLLPHHINITIHKCFKEYDENRNEIICNDNIVLTMVMKENETGHEDEEMESNGQSQFENIDKDEQLISAVAQRPALYDLSLPLNERTKLKKQALWDEVFNVMGGSLPRDDIPKRWKYLRDRYGKAKRDVNRYQPSGSSSDAAKPTTAFKYFQLMSFLDGIKATNEKTISNVFYSSPSEETSVSETDSGLAAPSKKRKSQPTTSNTALEDALIASLNTPISQVDEVDAFLIRVGASLKRLPLQKRSEVEIQFLEILMQAENNVL